MRYLLPLLASASLALGHIGAPPEKTIAYGDYLGKKNDVHTFSGNGYKAHIKFTESKVSSITIIWEEGNYPDFVTFSRTMNTLLNDEKVSWDVKNANRSGRGCVMYTSDKKYLSFTLLGIKNSPSILHLVKL